MEAKWHKSRQTKTDLQQVLDHTSAKRSADFKTSCSIGVSYDTRKKQHTHAHSNVVLACRVHLTDGRPVYETLRKNRKHYYNRDLVIIASYTGVQPHVFIADDTCEELPITMMATTLNEPAAAAAPPPLPLSQQVVVNSAVVVVPPSFPAAVVGAFPSKRVHLQSVALFGNYLLRRTSYGCNTPRTTAAFSSSY